MTPEQVAVADRVVEILADGTTWHWDEDTNMLTFTRTIDPLSGNITFGPSALPLVIIPGHDEPVDLEQFTNDIIRVGIQRVLSDMAFNEWTQIRRNVADLLEAEPYRLLDGLPCYSRNQIERAVWPAGRRP